MDKKETKEPQKNSGKTKKEAKVTEKETTGFPEGVDFKKFLGCGG